jgi:hypothetical protein
MPTEDGGATAPWWPDEAARKRAHRPKTAKLASNRRLRRPLTGLSHSTNTGFQQITF